MLPGSNDVPRVFTTWASRSPLPSIVPTVPSIESLFHSSVCKLATQVSDDFLFGFVPKTLDTATSLPASVDSTMFGAATCSAVNPAAVPSLFDLHELASSQCLADSFFEKAIVLRTDNRGASRIPRPPLMPISINNGLPNIVFPLSNGDSTVIKLFSNASVRSQMCMASLPECYQFL
jgi:hypothetical protein